MNLEFKDISLIYPGSSSKKNLILKDFSLKINEGEFVCLVGPSGCGKSSVLGMAAGFVKAIAGELTASGEKINRPEISRTLVFQDYALFPWLNVIENVAFGLKHQVKDKDERFILASKYLKMVGLLDNAKDKISNLSGGMKQRVAIARALAPCPKYLLMDEPFGALDEKTRTEMQIQLVELWKELGTSILFVTHSIDEALILADRVIVMNRHKDKTNGEVVAEIKIDQARPRSLSDLAEYRKQVNDALYNDAQQVSQSFDAII